MSRRESGDNMSTGTGSVDPDGSYSGGTPTRRGGSSSQRTSSNRSVGSSRSRTSRQSRSSKSTGTSRSSNRQDQASSIGETTNVDSNQSRGWSQYDESRFTTDTDRDFFPRALPAAAASRSEASAGRATLDQQGDHSQRSRGSQRSRETFNSSMEGTLNSSSLHSQQYQQNQDEPEFFASPMEYIFGGNDDDVSTIGGGRHGMGDSASVFDDSTIATTPTLASEFKKDANRQEAIIEVDEDEEEEGEDDDNNYNNTERKEEPAQGSSYTAPGNTTGQPSPPLPSAMQEQQQMNRNLPGNTAAGTNSSSFPQPNTSNGDGMGGVTSGMMASAPPPPPTHPSQMYGYQPQPNQQQHQQQYGMYGAAAGVSMPAAAARPTAGSFTGDEQQEQAQQEHHSAYRQMPPPPPRPQRRFSNESRNSRYSGMYGYGVGGTGHKSVSTLGMESHQSSSGASVMAGSVWDASTIATTPTMAREMQGQKQRNEAIIEVDGEDESTDASEIAGTASSASASAMDTMTEQQSSAFESSQQPTMQTRGSSDFQYSAAMPSITEEMSTEMTDESSEQFTQSTLGGTITNDDLSTVYDESSSLYPDDSASVTDGSLGSSRVLSRQRPALGVHSLDGSGYTEDSLNKSVRSFHTTPGQRGFPGAGSVGGDDARSLGGRSWRSEGYVLQNRRDDFRHQHFGGSARSAKSSRSMLPLDPVELHLTEGGPTMTQGMSGKPVVHVALHSDRDGSINRLEYSQPVKEIDEEETFMSETTAVMGNTDSNQLPWYSYYLQRSKIVQLCSSNKCARYNAAIMLFCCLSLSVAISVVASVENSGSTYRSKVPPGLEGLKAPPALGSSLSLDIENNVEDWFRASGNYKFQKDDVPLFWSIPMTGGVHFQDVVGSCLKFTVASEVGDKAASIAGISNETIKEVLVYGKNYVNVDTTTPEGIDHAKQLNLVPSSIPDIVFSPLLHQAASKLYSRNNKANLIVTMRHPVSRAVATYYYLRTATWDPNYDVSLATMSLEQFATSDFIDNNFVTRFLVNKPGGSLNDDDLKLAKEILRRKAVVGLYEDLGNSIEHIERYFSWTPVSDEAINCQKTRLRESLNSERIDMLPSGTTAYTLISQQNRYDIFLYQYVRNVLYPYQYEAIWRQTSYLSSTKN